MNRIAKIAALLVTLIAAFSFSQEENLEEPIVYDTIHMLNPDSLTVALLKESREFYSNSFSNILWLVGIIIAIGCAIFGSLGTWNWREAKKYNKETKEDLNKIRNELDSYREIKNLIGEKCRELYGEIEFTNFSLAISSFNKDGDNTEHFRRLAEHFFIFTNYKLIPANIDLSRLGYFDEWIEQYKGNDIEAAKILFHELKQFIEYGKIYSKETTSIEAAYLGEIKKIWEKLCIRFGGENEVLKAIENFNYNTYDYSFRKCK